MEPEVVKYVAALLEAAVAAVDLADEEQFRFFGFRVVLFFFTVPVGGDPLKGLSFAAFASFLALLGRMAHWERDSRGCAAWNADNVGLFAL